MKIENCQKERKHADDNSVNNKLINVTAAEALEREGERAARKGN